MGNIIEVYKRDATWVDIVCIQSTLELIIRTCERIYNCYGAVDKDIKREMRWWVGGVTSNTQGGVNLKYEVSYLYREAFEVIEYTFDILKDYLTDRAKVLKEGITGVKQEMIENTLKQITLAQQEVNNLQSIAVIEQNFYRLRQIILTTPHNKNIGTYVSNITAALNAIEKNTRVKNTEEGISINGGEEEED